MRRPHALSVPLAAAVLMVAAGCTPIGAATTVGAVAVTAAQEERGLDGAARDTLIRTAINTAWAQHDARLVVDTGLIVHERRVLLTGALDTQELVDAAVRLAWQAEGVVDVINEIRINPARTLGERARDALISGDVSRSLMFDSQIQSINYAVDVTDRTVYVMGVAQNQQELDRVLSWARNTDYVRRVVSHALLKDDPARTAPQEAR
ncbi:BON domain-containing protein [Novispirillum sp. DQ9]|uniref:BON domain-containing protein n=1 Tax=Novispirillum sp. DQ9 TaxID=3398612 RepID=UPI003C7D9E0F